VTSAREALLQLEADVSSLGEGRRFVARTLREWQVDEARIAPITLVANELVANAIVHAGSAPLLSLEASGSELMVRVADGSQGLPVAGTVTLDATAGRGLLLVETLGDRWGIDTNESGKVVWVVFAAALS
jgi:anti-sigma regulatory factor (Ser/Thr protein kinase)